MKLPARLTLPTSGARVELRATRRVGGGGDRASAEESRGRRAGDSLFADALEALRSDVVVTKDGSTIDVHALPLADFHVLRAVLAKAGIVREETVAIVCRNCDAPLDVAPCAGLEIGPYVDGELGDDELDATLAFDEPHPIPPVPLGRVRIAKTITLAARTVGEARPLFAALAKEHLDVGPEVVRAMGVVALGVEKDAARIAEALASCDDEAFAAVADLFLAAHYPPRLGCVAFCKECGARNDVDAPYDRELEPSRATTAPDANAAAGAVFPAFEAFAARAQEIAAPMVADIPGEKVDVVIDEGTPAVDEGGEPLLGSYVPPQIGGGGGSPTHAPLVTVYYRTFRAMWDDEGPYDWDAELVETIEHELEHHVYFLRGHDPMDDEERDVIRDEARRIVGRRESTRRAAEGFAASVREFFARTWPIWLLAFVALAIMLATQR